MEVEKGIGLDARSTVYSQESSVASVLVLDRGPETPARPASGSGLSSLSVDPSLLGPHQLWTPNPFPTQLLPSLEQPFCVSHPPEYPSQHRYQSPPHRYQNLRWFLYPYTGSPNPYTTMRRCDYIRHNPRSSGHRTLKFGGWVDYFRQSPSIQWRI